MNSHAFKDWFNVLFFKDFPHYKKPFLNSVLTVWCLFHPYNYSVHVTSILHWISSLSWNVIQRLSAIRTWLTYMYKQLPTLFSEVKKQYTFVSQVCFTVQCYFSVKSRDFKDCFNVLFAVFQGFLTLYDTFSILYTEFQKFFFMCSLIILSY